MKSKAKIVLIATSSFLACALFSCGGGSPASSSVLPSSSASSVASSSSVSHSFALSVHSLSLQAGETATLQVLSDLTGEASFVSSDPSIVSLNKNEVVALADGKATITATLEGYSDSCEVVVASTYSLTFSPTSEKLYVGESLSLGPSLFFGKKALSGSLSYVSSDPTVCTVDENGVVSGLKKGTSEISASVKDNPSVSAKISLKVHNRISIVPSLKETTLYANIAGSAKTTINVKVLKNSYNVSNPKVTATSLDESLLSISTSGGAVTINALKTGRSAVILTYEDETEAVVVTVYKGIKTTGDFALLKGDFKGYFRLMNDIDFAGAYLDVASPWMGDDATDDQYFNGVFDGDGHTLSHIAFASGWHRGIFGETGSKAVIKNVSMVGIKQQATSNMVGSLVALNYGTIENCYVENEIKGDSQSMWNAQGGLVALNGRTGLIKNCIVRTTASKTYQNTGALCGYNWATIENCYAITSGAELPLVYTQTGDLGKVENCLLSSEANEENLYSSDHYLSFDPNLWEINGASIPALKAYPSVAFEHPLMYLSIGTTYTLDPCSLAGVKQSWSFSAGYSDSFAVLALESGIEITPIKEGDCQATVSLENGKSASVTLSAKNKVLSTGEESLALDFGNPTLASSKQVVFRDEAGSLVPASALGLSSSDTSVFTVDATGIVTASGGGSAALNVVYGSDVYSAFLKVEVTPWTGIKDLSGLNDIRNHLSAHYVLLNDIDGGNALFATITPWDGKGESYHFGGVFDGNGHTVKNLQLASGVDTAGIFGQTADTSVIRDVAFEAISAPSAMTRDYGIVGMNEGLIENVSVRMSATHGASSDVHSSSALVGTNEFRGVLRSCYSVLEVPSFTDGEYLAGLVGLNQGSATTSFSVVYGASYRSVTNAVGYENGYSAGLSIYKDETLTSASNMAVSALTPFGDFSSAYWTKKEGELPSLTKLS